MNALHPIVDAPLWAVLLFKVTAILTAAWAGHAALTWANPRWRVLLWRVTAVSLVVLPGVTLLLPGLDIRLARPVVEDVVEETAALETAVVEAPPAVDWAPALPLHGTPDEVFFEDAPQMTIGDSSSGFAGIDLETATPVAPEPPAGAESTFSPWVTFPALAWLAGVVLLGFRLCLGHLRIRTLARGSRPTPGWVRDEAARVAEAIGCRRRVDVIQSADIPSPLLCGLRRSLLVLPSRMCEPGYRADLPAILAHELTHARVYDVPWNAVLQAISSIFWFHPLVWRVRGAHLAACELAADSASASFVGDVADYCRTLARVAVDAHAPVPACGIAMARTSAIGRRLTALKKRVFHLPLRRRNVAAFGFVALLGVALLGSLQFAVAEPAATASATEAPQEESNNRQEKAAPSAQDPPEADSHTPPPKLDWLRGSGKDLRIRIRGEVVNDDGAPAEDFRLEVLARVDSGERELPVEIRGNRFSFWVPVGKSVPFYVRVNATSSDGRFIARPMIYKHAFRRAAVDGFILKMKPAERSVEVTVLKDDKPLPGAFVSARLTEFYNDNHVTVRTNDAGVATFGVIEGETLSGLTAWTEDFMVGGCTFSRDPSSPTTNRHTVELQCCRPQRVRVIDAETGAPVPGLAFRLWIGTGPPSNPYLGNTPECELTTDENGEAVDHWFPDWEHFRSSVKIQDPHWTTVGKEVADGVIVVRVKKDKVADRKRIIGRVESKDANTSGLLVMMNSFQGEKKNHSDHLAAFTGSDGKFAAEYLPGATYCVFVNDARFVSNVIDLIPYEPETEEAASPGIDALARTAG